ncbi:hypothetical protein [Alkalispirochaeta americana]|nr:hypothetical protein [Alkalispirochaeta americana]
MIMIALLLHAGGAGVDSSSSVEIALYQGASLEGRWQGGTVRQEGIYSLPGDSGRLFVQRLHEPDLTYAVVFQPSRGENPPLLALLSLAALHRDGGLPRSGLPEGELLIPLEALHSAAAENQASRRDGVPEEKAPEQGELSGESGAVVLRWRPGEVEASVADQGILALLRY